ncbi:MAG TPA: lipopolysaccharide biosynthesis protein RfbH [Marinilabiliales bacterium]|nr:lipopolysaccharide biosynthesis protein RfbH [Marinilabiliales bacterium]
MIKSVINNKSLKLLLAKTSPQTLNKILRKDAKTIAGIYYKTFHSDKKFIPGKTRIQYAGRYYDQKEIANLIDASLDFWLTAGRFEKEFCRKLSDFLGVKYVVTTNSGSSANLLAISALTSPKLGNKRLKKGDEVITVAAGFPTTVTPIVQNGLVPVFVDIELGTYNIDVSAIEKAITKKTRAIFIAHTLGIPFETDKILKIANKHNLWFIEDNCDALGTKHKGKYTGTFGHLATLSFYPAHHITTGEGGAVITNDRQLKTILASFRDWGRDCWCEPGCDDTCNKRFKWQLGKLPYGYDHKYTYSHLGYNLKMTDLQASIGVAQMDKLPSFINSRKQNWDKLYRIFKPYEKLFILPRYPNKSDISPFGFVVTIKDKAPFSRNDIVTYLENCGIQTRMVFAGNITKQPMMTGVKHRISGKLKNTDKVMMNTFWLGVYPGITGKMMEYIKQKIEGFLNNRI